MSLRASDARHQARQANPYPSHQSPSQLWLGLLVQGPRDNPICCCCCLACWNIFMVALQKLRVVQTILSESMSNQPALAIFSPAFQQKKPVGVTDRVPQDGTRLLYRCIACNLDIQAVGQSSLSFTRRLNRNMPVLSQLGRSAACMHTIWLPSGSRDQDQVNININQQY